MANPNLQKIIKLTQSQYNTLANGGTVGDYTGLNDNYLYLIQEDYEFPTTTTARKILMSTSTAGLVSWESLTANDIPNLAASKITSGTFSADRIPNLNASKITAGTFDIARIPTGTTASTVALGNHNHDSTYLKLSGGTVTGKLQVNALIFGYNYTNSNNRAAFMFDKPGSNYTGIGAHAESDTIYFGACDGSGNWVDTYKQKWKFNGTIVEDGTSLSDKYLGISAKAADADKLDGQDSTYYLNYNNLNNKPTIPSVSNATITIKQTGISDQTFTLNGSAVTITLVDTNTWRPLGTGATDACAGNDSRLSDARPASDVYAWAKASTKPSYTLDEIGAGVLTIGDGANRLMFRTNASYANGIYYSTPGNEALVFATKYSVTSWIFATTDPTQQSAWTGLTPSLQIKNGRVTINKLIAGGTDAAYNLDVNGTLNATTIYQNGSALAAVATSGSYNDLSNKPTIPTKSSWNYDDVYIKYSAAQTLTDAQKTQARSNIGAGTSSFTGYTSSNKLHTDYINNAAGWTSVTSSTVSGWGFTKNIGTVTSITLGLVAYTPDSGGVVALPAYPTTLPASDVYSWAKQANKPSYTASEVGALASDAKVVLYTSQSLTNLQKSTARSNIGAGTSSLALGETATTAAAGNHTHALFIVSGGTASINLAANTTYTLTAGGTTYSFKMPPASSAYYANQYNTHYYLSSNSGASLFSYDIQAGTSIVELDGGNALGIIIGWPGLAPDSSKKTLLFNGNRADLVLSDTYQNYIKGLSIDMYDDDYYTLHIRANDYSNLQGSVATENGSSVKLHAWSFEYEPYSVNAAVTHRQYVYFGVVMHNITYTYSNTVLLKMNIRGDSHIESAINSYANLCLLLYNAGHRSPETCLTCSGRYSSYTYIVLGVYATSYNSGLNLVYCTHSSNSVSTLPIPSGTIKDTLAASLVP